LAAPLAAYVAAMSLAAYVAAISWRHMWRQALAASLKTSAILAYMNKRDSRE